MENKQKSRQVLRPQPVCLYSNGSFVKLTMFVYVLHALWKASSTNGWNSRDGVTSEREGN